MDGESADDRVARFFRETEDVDDGRSIGQIIDDTRREQYERLCGVAPADPVGVDVVIRDCIELADCAHPQTGCADSCGCTDCDLRETVHRLPAALAAHDEQVRAEERERLAGTIRRAMVDYERLAGEGA